MAKWVTFYETVLNGVTDVLIHENKQQATSYFINSYREYFPLANNLDVRLPISFGYPHAKFKGMPKRMFEKNYYKL